MIDIFVGELLALYQNGRKKNSHFYFKSTSIFDHAVKKLVKFELALHDLSWNSRNTYKARFFLNKSPPTSQLRPITLEATWLQIFCGKRNQI